MIESDTTRLIDRFLRRLPNQLTAQTKLRYDSVRLRDGGYSLTFKRRGTVALDVQLLPRRLDRPCFRRLEHLDLMYRWMQPEDSIGSSLEVLLELLARKLAQLPPPPLLIKGKLDGIEMMAPPCHLVQEGQLDDFDPALCESRPESRPLHIGRDWAILLEGGGASLYRPKAPVGDPLGLVIIKNIRVHGYLAGEGGMGKLEQHEACKECNDLYRCPTCLRMTGETGCDPRWGDGVVTLSGKKKVRLPLLKLLGNPLPLYDALSGADRRQMRLKVEGPNPFFVLQQGPRLPADLKEKKVLSVWAPLRLLALLRDFGLEPSRAPGVQPFSEREFELSLKVREKEREKPVLGLLCFNGRCVTLCRYCNLPLRIKHDMSFATAILVLDQFCVCGVNQVDLFGGEVTLRDELEDVVAYAAHIGLDPMFITTGAGLTGDRCQRLVDRGVSFVQVSIDSPNSAVHDRMKGKAGLFNKAVKAIRSLRSAGAEVNINTVMHSESYRDMQGLCQLAHSLGVRGVNLFHCVSMPRLGLRTPLLSLEEVRELYEKVIPTLIKEGEELGVEVNLLPKVFTGPMDREPVYERLSRGIYNNIYGTEHRCHHVPHSIFVNTDGDVIPCLNPTVAMEPDRRIGNLLETPLWQLLTGEEMQSFLEQSGQFEECKQCIRTHEMPW